MVKDRVHRQIVRNLGRVEEWFKEKKKDLDLPFYSSFDIRDFGHKVTNVDANIFPAGFNNICQVDRENAGDLAREYIKDHYVSGAKNLLIITEEHTNNRYYWDNVSALKKIVLDAGLNVELAVLKKDLGPAMSIESASYGDVLVQTATIQDGHLVCSDFVPDLVISNNDFSDSYEGMMQGKLDFPINPPRELGWYQRKKSTYFKHYNHLCHEFAELIDLDPWLFTVETELFSGFDLSNDDSRERLAVRVEKMLESLRISYSQRGIEDHPVLFIKNNAGTYGLAVMRVESADDIRNLNYKHRKKMKAAKGGRVVEEVIIQEGVPSIVTDEGLTAEPAIYLLGCQLAGGFLRTHAEKGPTESLNSPGAVYRRLCVSDLRISVEGHPLENVYGWVARLGALAIGRESQEMNVIYRGYNR